MQEFKNAAAVSGDKNIAEIYKLESSYLSGNLLKPTDPQGKPYDDPRCCPHIQAATLISPEVKRIAKDEPWLANKKHPIVANFRQLGKIYNYALIYLATAQTLSLQASKSVEECEADMAAYFSYPDGFYGLHTWLMATAEMAAAQHWVREPMGGMLFCHETNAKGDSSATRRKGVNGCIQGLSAVQSKLASIYIHKDFARLNKKHSKQLAGREGRIIAPVHDEFVSLIPGDIYMLPVIDPKQPDLITYEPKFDLTLPEHAMAYEYGRAMKLGMEKAMAETYDKIGTDIPPGADIDVGKYWIHG